MSSIDVETIAAICHDANRRLCLSLGDDSQPLWDDAPNWQRDSIINGVDAILDDSDIEPHELHEMWMNIKLNDGWVYGEEKDADKKTHPSLVPYDELPVEHKLKDYLFRSIVRAFLECEEIEDYDGL